MEFFIKIVIDKLTMCRKKTYRIFILLISLYFIDIEVQAQCENWLWIKSAASNLYDEGKSVDVDSYGNVYVVGNYEKGAIGFGSKTLPQYDDYNIFIVKYDTSGNVLWAKGTGGSKAVNANGVACDDSGYVYMVGDFWAPTITFGSTVLTNSGSYDMFITKWDKNGNLIWAKKENRGYAYGVATDVIGNTYVAGDFSQDTTQLKKFDPNGNLIWSNQVWSKTGAKAKCIATNEFGHVYVAGIGFVAKYDTSGTKRIWIDTTNVGGINDITTNSTGDVYIVGQGGFIKKYGTQGNTVWSRGAINNPGANSNCVVSDNFNNVYLAGSFSSSNVTFESTISSDNVILPNTTSGQREIFFVKYDYDGNIDAAEHAAGDSNETANGITADNWGNVYMTGYFQSDTISFVNLSLTNNSDKDMFLVKMGNNFLTYYKKTNLICKGDSSGSIDLTLVGSTGPYSFSWDNGDSLEDISNLKEGTYVVQIADIKGCVASKSITITAPAKIALNLLPSNTCSIGNNGKIDLTVLGGSPPYKYNWSNGDSIEDIIGLAAGNYSVVVTDTNGCIASGSTKIDTLVKPVADFTINIDTQCLSSNNFIFTNMSYMSTGGILTYQWNLGDGNTSALKDVQYSYAKDTSYLVELVVTTSSNCKDSISKWIHIYPSPVASFNFSNNCQGDSTLFNNTSVQTMGEIINYLWDYGDSNSAIVWGDPKHYYDSAGIFTVTLNILTKDHCKSSTSKSITVYPQPILTLPFAGDTSVVEGDSIYITASGIYSTILWSNGQTTQSIIISDSGQYFVTVASADGCSDSQSFYVSLILAPTILEIYNTFSPNGDGVNDYFKIPRSIKPCKITIYNRWGQELYSSPDYNDDWDAEYKGKRLPQGSYFYILETKNNKIIKGTISIIR